MYMIHQRLTTAVRVGYRGADVDTLARELAEARRTIGWLERLHVDDATKASLIEPVAVVEEALAESVRISSRPGGNRVEEPAP